VVQPARATVSWEGDSLNVLKKWPNIVQNALGASLLRLQEGKRPTLVTRTMQSIGRGVFEDTIYVLDSFTKKSRKTEKNDLNRAKARLSQVRQRLQEARTDAKRKSD